MDVKGRQVGPCSITLVLVLVARRGAGPRWNSRVASSASLDARLLIGARHVVVLRQRLALPRAMAPGTNSVIAAQALDRAVAESRHQATAACFCAQVGHAPAGERVPVPRRKLAGQRFDLFDQLRREKLGAADPSEDVPSARQGHPRTCACATGSRRPDACLGARRFPYSSSLQRRGGSAEHGRLQSTATYFSVISSPKCVAPSTRADGIGALCRHLWSPYWFLQ
jgi:hypothetical protein